MRARQRRERDRMIGVVALALCGMVYALLVVLNLDRGDIVVVTDENTACTAHFGSDEVIATLSRGRRGKVIGGKFGDHADWRRVKLEPVEGGPANGRACWINANRLQTMRTP